MSVGYICSSVLGAALAILCLASRRLKDVSEEFALRLLSSFDDCATFFAFSIQIACIVVLARVDYGISAASMGDVTVRITWTVSVLTLLPLVYALLLPGTLKSRADRRYVESVGAKAAAKGDRRTLLFSICWACAVYPFMSRMIEGFGRSLIGDGPDDVLSFAEWHTLGDICLAGTWPPTDAEYRLINAFGIMSFLLLSMLAVGKVIVAGLRRHHEKDIRLHVHLGTRARQIHHCLELGLVTFVPTLSMALIWSYFRLQNFQRRIANAIGAQDSDGQWGFGQVVSVVVFLTVVAEALFGWYEKREDHNEVQEIANEQVVEIAETGQTVTDSEADDGVDSEMSPSVEDLYRRRQSV